MAQRTIYRGTGGGGWMLSARLHKEAETVEVPHKEVDTGLCSGSFREQTNFHILLRQNQSSLIC
jgi:hypothetical protein